MKLMTKILAMLLALTMMFTLSACGASEKNAQKGTVATAVAETTVPSTETLETAPETRIIVDYNGREVEIPYTVESIVCVGVGALRYSCYVGAADLVVGVEDYETKPGMSRLYNYVNFDKFKNLPVTGS